MANFSLGKRLLSFFTEITIESCSSRYHPVLKVKLLRGKLILDGQRVNYAFGGLDTFFRLSTRLFKIPGKNAKKALILGFGVGNVAFILKEKIPDLEITGVEIDPVMVKLARRYFNLGKLTNTRVLIDDVGHYLKTANSRFDLIVIDVFVEDKVPDELSKRNILLKLKALLNPCGSIFFNLLYSTPKLQAETREFVRKFENAIGPVETHEVYGNLPLVYRKSGKAE